MRAHSKIIQLAGKAAIPIVASVVASTGASATNSIFMADALAANGRAGLTVDVAAPVYQIGELRNLYYSTMDPNDILMRVCAESQP